MSMSPPPPPDWRPSPPWPPPGSMFFRMSSRLPPWPPAPRSALPRPSGAICRVCDCAGWPIAFTQTTENVAETTATLATTLRGLRRSLPAAALLAHGFAEPAENIAEAAALRRRSPALPGATLLAHGGAELAQDIGKPARWSLLGLLWLAATAHQMLEKAACIKHSHSPWLGLCRGALYCPQRRGSTNRLQWKL